MEISKLSKLKYIFVLIALAGLMHCNRVNVQVNSDPQGATVTNAAGEEIGVTPFSQSLKRDDGMDHSYTFALEGHEAVEHAFTLPTEVNQIILNVDIPGIPVSLGTFRCGTRGPDMVGKKITTYGYVYPGIYLTMCSDLACDVDIQPAPGMGSFAQMEASMDFGTEPLQMDELPENYTLANFKYRDSDGAERNAYSRVKITGTLSYFNYGDNDEYHDCSLHNVRIEAP